MLDTHDHADHVSGRLRLAQATGARPHRPGPREDGATDAIVAGEQIAVGSVWVTVMATPSHRPEHLTFLVSDLSRGPEPWLIISGDSLLVGDIARPDLAGPHRRLAVRGSRSERQVELHDRR